MRRSWLIALSVVVVVAAGVAVLLLSRGTRGDEGGQAAPTASITVAPVASSVLTDVASAYGMVQADPAGVVTITAPRPLIVQQVEVTLGQTVAAGHPLMTARSAPAAEMAFRQAQNAVTSATSDLARIRRLFSEHLASNDQVTTAQKTLADAQAALAAQVQQGGGAGSQTFRAPGGAVVTAIAASPGDRIAQDAALITLARQGAVNVKIGLEPGNPFAVGDPVTLTPTTGGPPIPSHLAMVGKTTDPATHTIDALAPLNGAALPIGSGVEAEVVTGTHHGLTVPRPAVVFDETGDHLFIVEGGKARRVFVTVGRNYGDRIEVKGPISAGQQVAATGAYELQDGMAVKVAGQ